MAAITVKVARIVGFPTSLIVLQMALDVFNHDDGVVDQDPDGKDEGEQGDPVQGITHEIVNRESQGQRHRNGDGDDQRSPKAHEYRDQHGNRKSREQKMLDQLVRFVRGGRAVIAHHGHSKIGLRALFRREHPGSFQKLL